MYNYIKLKEMITYFNQENAQLHSEINDNAQQLQSENLMLRSQANELHASVDQQKTENAG